MPPNSFEAQPQTKKWSTGEPEAFRKCAAAKPHGAQTRNHFAGSRISRSLVALSTAAFVNGNARGVTLRQSSS